LLKCYPNNNRIKIQKPVKKESLLNKQDVTSCHTASISSTHLTVVKQNKFLFIFIESKNCFLITYIIIN
jgi:hypothetical protein